MTKHFAYLAQGKLYLHHADRSQEIESEFGKTVQSRSLQMKRQKAWKNKSINEMMMPAGLRQKLDGEAESVINTAITSVCQSSDGQIFYALSAGGVSGLFAYNQESNNESRIFHNSEFQVEDIDFNAKHDLIVCTKTHPTGISNIAIMPKTSIRLQEITEGDSLDLAPRWISGQDKAIVYQSAGISRTNDGYVADRSPYTIEKLDFDTEEMVTVAADPKSDLVSPRIGQDGLLYYIRRPYKFKPKNGFLQTIGNILLMPIRLMYAIFQFFNFFTQMYTGKPMLQTQQNPQPSPKIIKAWGDYLTPDLMKNQSYSEPDAPALVPATWVLVRQDLAQGEAQILAQAVLSFDLCADGSIVYTNGSGVYCLQPDGNCQRLLVSNWVELVRSLD